MPPHEGQAGNKDVIEENDFLIHWNVKLLSVRVVKFKKNEHNLELV